MILKGHHQGTIKARHNARESASGRPLEVMRAEKLGVWSRRAPESQELAGPH